MKVILLVDDRKLGNKNSIIEVADGYANNVLIPKNIATPATKDNLNKLNNQLAKEAKEFELKKSKAISLADEIKKLNKLIIKVPSSSSGKIFGSVTSSVIAEELSINHNISVDKKNIQLETTIKSIGCYTVKIKLFQNITVDLIVEVVTE